MEALPDEHAKPVLTAAKRARRRSQRVFTCSVPAGYTTGVFASVRKKKRVDVDSFDLGPLIEEIERMGWSLSGIDYVNIPGRGGTSGVGNFLSIDLYGQIQAHMIFRVRG